jgi:hypothetical protein
MDLSFAISFLTANFAYAAEFQNIFMAVQGAMAVRNGPNKDGKMKSFHAFLQGVVTAFAGGIMTPLWMGRATPMLANDLCFGCCIIAFLLVNSTPLDIGHKVLNLFPFRMLTIMGAQLFRNRGIIAFVNIAHQTFKENPSPYYPTPVFGPILNACILGNMGSFFFKGFHGHLKDGMPYIVQNGLFVASTYHFIANDQGPIGEYLREAIAKLPIEMDPVLLITLVGGLFMQISALLQMPDFFGPSFNPFDLLLAPINAFSKPKVQKTVQMKIKTVSESAPSQKKSKSQKKKAAQKKKK